MEVIIMDEGKRADGRRLAAESVEILKSLRDELPGLTGKVDSNQIPVWRGKVEALVDELLAVKEKLFLKTQDGTRLAQSALEKLKSLDEAVRRGIDGQSADDATGTVEQAMEEMAGQIGALIEKTKSQIIRMT
jgi:hypothetical protein